MPRTQINCPQCRQPIIADILQLFDVGQEPQLKQIFLSGTFNIAQCPHCGFQGMLSTPLVYHDPTKELLLTFFPPESGLPVHMQEKTIGPLINQVVNNLPQEKRKGYLFNPKTMLTLQLMLEIVLEADGITKEMIQAQENRLNLVRRLLSTSADARLEIIQQEDALIDGDFFTIFSRLMETALAGQDETSAKQLTDLQNLLLEHSTQGKELQAEAQEVQAALEALQKLGDKLTRESLLDLVMKAPTETRLEALARFARPGMDYAFFQMLSDRIDSARSKGKDRLIEIREKLLAYTQKVDQEMEQRLAISRQNVTAVLQAEDMKAVLQQNIEAIDDFFIQAATHLLEDARKKGDLSHSARLQQILDTIQELSAPPPEIAFIEGLLEIAADEEALKTAIADDPDEITPELMQMLNTLVARTQAGLEQAEGAARQQQKEVLDRLQAVYNAVLGFSMRRSFKGS